MSALWRALQAERCKLRHTLALVIVVLAPLALALIYTALGIMQPGMLVTDPGLTPWQGFLRMVLPFWGGFLLPLFVVLEAGLLAELEHKNRQWKHLLALPVPHAVHYLAKCVALLVMLVFAILLATAFVVLAGWVVQWQTPQLDWPSAPPWVWLGVAMVKCCAGAVLMAMLQLWLALRWHNFIGVMATGLVAVFFGAALPHAARAGLWYPWSMAGRVMRAPHAGVVLSVALLLALAVVWVGSRDALCRACG